MAFVKKAVDGVTAPLKTVKGNYWAILGLLGIVLIAFRFRGQIMAGLAKIGLGGAASKITGEG